MLVYSYSMLLVTYVKYGLDPSFVSWLLLTRFLCSFLFLSHYLFHRMVLSQV